MCLAVFGHTATELANASSSLPAPNREALRVWLIGDSITQASGYRQRLHETLAADGHNVLFIGSHTADSSNALVEAGQHHHDGHGGWRIADAIEAVSGPDRTADVARPAGAVRRRDKPPATTSPFRPGWLHNEDGSPPSVGVFDIAMIHLGSNDVRFPRPGREAEGMSQRLEDLVREILRHRPDITVYLAQIAPQRRSQRFERIVAYNNDLPNVARRLNDEGHDVRVIDVFEGFMHKDWQDPSDIRAGWLAPDGVHMADAGNATIAQTYFDAIVSHLKHRTLSLPVGSESTR